MALPASARNRQMHRNSRKCTPLGLPNVFSEYTMPQSQGCGSPLFPAKSKHVCEHKTAVLHAETGMPAPMSSHIRHRTPIYCTQNSNHIRNCYKSAGQRAEKHTSGHTQRGLGGAKQKGQEWVLFKGVDALEFHPDRLLCQHTECGV